MAKRGRIEQTTGPVVDVTPEERTEIRKLRLAKKLTQEQLAAKIGVSNGTISNLETGRSGQTRRVVYLEALAFLKASAKSATTADDGGARFKRVMDKYLELDLRGQEAVEALIDSQLLSLKKSV